MTNPKYQHVIIIRDRSGSIESILDGMQSGYDEFIQSQVNLSRDHGLKITGSLWDFDDVIDNRISFQDISTLAGSIIVPRNMTAMLDAIGIAVTTEGAKLAAMPEEERPNLVTVVIASDGLENASKTWSAPQVRSILTQQQDVYAWKVTYIGTNQDALKEGENVGVAAASSLNYSNTSRGTKNAWRASGQSVNAVAMAAAAAPESIADFNITYTEEQRREAMEVEED